MTLLIVEIKVPGSPEGPASFPSLTDAIAEQWREHLALFVCYGVIGAYWLQHHYSGSIFAKSDHGLSAANLLFLLAIVVVPYPIRVWCFHIGTEFEASASVILVSGLALNACTWMIKWFYGMSGGRRVMDERLDPGFLKRLMRRYGLATIIQLAAIPVTVAAPRVGVALCLLCGAFFLLPQPKPVYRAGDQPNPDAT